MKLGYLLELVKGDIISIAGSGGKTSLMFELAREYKNNKVLVTTSTKIFKPKEDEYDYLACRIHEGEAFKLNNIPGVYVLGYDINSENKLVGIDDSTLRDYYKYFDYIFIESDGSKRKELKGWNEKEPVILEGTTKTIGVVSIKVLGSVVCKENTHRMEEFIELTGLSLNEKIGIKAMAKLILHKKGLFKNSLGERILFINKVESIEDMINAEKLAESIRNINLSYIDRIVIGSIKNQSFKLIYDRNQTVY